MYRLNGVYCEVSALAFLSKLSYQSKFQQKVTLRKAAISLVIVFLSVIWLDDQTARRLIIFDILVEGLVSIRLKELAFS